MKHDDFALTDEERMIRDLARKVAREKIVRWAAEVDEQERYPTESLEAIKEAGLYGIWVPEEYGGSDMGCLALALVCEEIAWACAATATQYLDQPLGGLPILRFGTEAQKTKYLPRLATGELLAAYSLSEPGAGSDAAGLRTTAVRRGDRYVLNGSKQWCTNGDHADVIVVFATIDPKLRAKGVTAFLVERGMPGFAVGKKEKKMGIRASPTVALHFTDCAVPVANRLGEEGEGFTIAMETLDVTRPATGSMAVGIGQAALDAAVAYARERHQFGRAVAAFQGIQFMLADMATSARGTRPDRRGGYNPPTPLGEECMALTRLSRRMFLNTTATGAALGFAPRALRAQPATFKLGVIHPVTGPLAEPGQACRLRAQMAADAINAAGGIQALRGVKAEVLLGGTPHKA